MKKFIAVAVVALTLGFFSVAKAGTFSDVPQGHWAADAVQKLADMGLVIGYEDGTFRGDNPMTRYEYAMIVSRMIDWLNNTYCTKDGCKSTGGGTVNVAPQPPMPENPAIDTSNFATKDQIPNINTSAFVTTDQLAEAKDLVQKLAAEFKDELAALKAQVDKNTGDIESINKRLDGMLFSKIRVDGYIRQRIDVLDSDLAGPQLAGLISQLHGINNPAVPGVLPVNSLNAGYEMVPGLTFSDATSNDNVYFKVALKQHIVNKAALGAIARTGGTPLDIDEAYVALDFAKNVRELDALKLTSGYQKVVFGPYGGLVDNRGLDSTVGVRMDIKKDIVSLAAFGGLAGITGNGGNAAGLGSSTRDPYAAVRLGLGVKGVDVGFNWLPNGVGSEKAWGADIDAKLLKNSPFLKAVRAEYFKITDTVAGKTPLATAKDNSLIAGLDVYKSKNAGLTLSYANIPAVTVLSGVDATPLAEYDTNCPLGLDVSDDSGANRCYSFESGNIMFPAGFKGLGVQANYTVLGDVELGAKAIMGDFAGGKVPAAALGYYGANANLKGITYPGYGSLSVTKPINKDSKFRVEYFQQGKDPVLISRVRGELLINF